MDAILNYLMLEDLLVQRLTDELPELKAILTAMDLSSVQANRQMESAAHVIYMGDEVGSGHLTQGSTGAAQVTAQIWMVVLVIKFAGTVSTGKGNREKAGPLIAKLLKALCGWQPAAPMTALRRIGTSNLKVGYDNGFAYYPFQFKSTHVLLGKL
ncbi:MAG: hypothetical protein K2P84_00090 [Undibacterium sp.]|nr:hypothetical protein [Undibacterium sp.]